MGIVKALDDLVGLLSRPNPKTYRVLVDKTICLQTQKALNNVTCYYYDDDDRYCAV